MFFINLVRNYHNELPIHIASRCGNFKFLHRCIAEEDLDLNEKGANGQTILLIALYKMAMASRSGDNESLPGSLPKIDNTVMLYSYAYWHDNTPLIDEYV
jgi:hypothetical protein